jgi:hypothetical protein
MSTYKADCVKYEGIDLRLTDVVERARYYVMRKDSHADRILSDLYEFAIRNNDTCLLKDILKLHSEFNTSRITISSHLPSTPADSNNLPFEFIAERLKKHFKYIFTKDGGGFETLMNLLQCNQSDYKRAIIACQIYNSKYFIKGDFKTFSSWYKTFCDIMGCKFHKDYKPSNLMPQTEEEKMSYNFLKN